MKLNTLQLRRALSAALFALLLSAVGTKNALAQNQVATLQHNDTITAVFYGQNAFASAHSAAVNGDIITLSSGTFNCCDITKSINIHGAGCVYDSITQMTPTIITGDFFMYNNNISFEGMYFTGYIRTRPNNNNINFIKCNLKIGNNYGGGVRMNWQFVNCIIEEFSFSDTNMHFHGLSLINSVVRFTRYYHSDIHNPTTINNSIVIFDNVQSNPLSQNINNIVAYNSIIAQVPNHTVSNCTYFNCIGIGTGEASLFEGQTVQNVMEVNSYEEVFETFTGTVSYDNIYQLNEEIATTFLGHDGTEVGIYGGVMPYRTRPNYMIIKNCNVAGRTTEDNKLGVEIELLNAGE